jgi:hypothetical protein
VVNGVSDDFLAGSGFAAQQHGRFGWCHLVHLGKHVMHDLAAADYILDAVFVV